MTPEFKEVYDATMLAIDALIAQDPAPDTPEGKLLNGLAAAIEEYEKVEFPFPADTEGKA
jgi:hypothetical protein